MTVDYNSKVVADRSSHLEKVIHDKAANEKEFIIELINLYRNLPTLWNIKHKYYKNKKKRRNEFDILLEKYREKYPDANRTDVIKRIKNLRTVYRRELKRKPPHAISPLYYFNAMDFLRNNMQNDNQPYLDETEVFEVCTFILIYYFYLNF